MTSLAPAIRRLLPLVLAAGLACENDDCDDNCWDDYEDCASDNASDTCDAERDRCIAICGSQPSDYGEER